MGVAVWILAGAVCVVGVRAFLRGRRGRSGGPVPVGWREAAGELGLQVVVGSAGRDLEISGVHEGLEVRIRAATGGVRSGAIATRFCARSADLAHGLRLGPRTGPSAADGLGPTDVVTGDAGFDAAVSLAGAEVEAIALLDPQTRLLVGEFVRHHGGRVEGGEVRSGRPGGGDPRGRLVVEVRLLADVARRLTPGLRTLPERLEHNATHDPMAAVRSRNLTLLVERYPRERAAADACAWTLANARDLQELDAVLAAARFMGEAGWPPMQALTESAAASEGLRVRAFEYLVEEVRQARLLPMLERGLDAGCAGVERRAVRELGALGQVGAAYRICARLGAEDPRTVAVAAEALGRLGDGAAEAPLLPCIEHADRGVRLAVVGALERVGSRAAVEALQGCVGAAATGRDRELQAAAQTALDAIRKRIGTTSAGRLSVVETPDPGGGLSVVAEAGGLALAQEGADEGKGGACGNGERLAGGTAEGGGG